MLFKCTSFIYSEEAENERMHLMTALQLRKPTQIFRLGVVVSQGKYTGFSVNSEAIAKKTKQQQ